MDVTLNTNFLQIKKPNLNSGTVGSDTADFALDKNTEKQFDYTELMMDLEDIQNFLFMMIGSQIPEDIAESDKGKKLNLLA